RHCSRSAVSPVRAASAAAQSARTWSGEAGSSKARRRAGTAARASSPIAASAGTAQCCPSSTRGRRSSTASAAASPVLQEQGQFDELAVVLLVRPGGRRVGAGLQDGGEAAADGGE